MLQGVFNFPNALTLSRFVFTVGIWIFSFHHQLLLALFSLLITTLIDAYDGKMGCKYHKTQEQKEFGKNLDSFVDLADFGVSPIIIAINLGFYSVLGTIGMILYLCAAAWRLSSPKARS